MKSHSIIISLIVILLACNFADAKYSGGTGEPNDPYQIATPPDLNDIGNYEEDWDKHFILVNDVNLAEYSGTQFKIIGIWLNTGDLRNKPFTGIFDGNGQKVLNFTWESTGRNGIGLFGYVESGAHIKNVGLENVNIDAGDGGHIGALVGLNGGTISACYSTGDIRGRIIMGGLVGHNAERYKAEYYNDPEKIINCYSTANIFCQWQWESCGGLVGSNGGTIINCYSTGRVSETGFRLGGLAGYGGAVVNSFWDIETSGQSQSYGGKGKTTAEMKMASTYYGWGGCGNEEVWTIDEGSDYPRLAWEGKPGELIPQQQLSDSVTGSGAETDPYLITTGEQLNLIGLFPCEWDKHFELVNDVNLSSYTGRQFNIIRVFNGVFDGKDHRVWNFTLEYTGQRAGLFADLVGGLIKNLGLENVDVNAVAINDSPYVGALAGRNLWGTIRKCYASGMVAATGCVGGLAGENSGWMEGCYFEGAVSGVDGVGGLVGLNYSFIRDCYSTGIASGGAHVGGLVGQNGYSWHPGGSINACYATGNVSGESGVGGLCGENYGVIGDCFWDIQTSGEPNMCGSGDCDSSYGKTTAEMKQQSTFQDWDFIDVWDIGENQTYPYLRTVPAGDINKDKTVNFLDLCIFANQWLTEW
ncbi:MAG: hypothetical protein JXN61_08690 [Sedimentisphaerales bacterium]|nr:hypothetical protein [Sedimentisphaerales bacterium]